MNMKTFSLIALTALILTSCVKPSQSTENTGVNGEFQVEYLFEKDGVKVYRFYDNGNYRYFTTLGETITTQSNGKSSYTENIK